MRFLRALYKVLGGHECISTLAYTVADMCPIAISLGFATLSDDELQLPIESHFLNILLCLDRFGRIVLIYNSQFVQLSM